MNIVFVSGQPFPYGMAGSKRIRLFAEYLSVNHTVSVLIAGSSNGRNPSEGEKDKVKFKFYSYTRRQSIFALRKTRKILSINYKKDVKNILFIYDGIGLTTRLFAAAGRRMGYKIVTDVVEDYSLHEENTGLLLSALHKINTLFEKKTGRFADGVITLSSRLEKKFSSLMAAQPVVLIPVSAENLGIAVGGSATANLQFTFLYSGSYGNKDGVDILIEAFSRLSADRNDVRLVLAGRISKITEQQIQNKKNIEYAGMIPDESYYAFLGKADVLLMTRVNTPYANSGFPFKLGEYLATGRPVIATTVSDVELYLKDRQSVIFAKPSDVTSLYEALRFAVNNKAQLQEIGKKGKEACALFFNPEVNGKKLEEFLISLS
ncbi:MAG: glycosyltransferase [Bacteroidia bacterium]